MTDESADSDQHRRSPHGGADRADSNGEDAATPDGRGSRSVTRRRVLRAGALAGGVGLAGCGSALEATTPTRDPTLTPTCESGPAEARLESEWFDDVPTDTPHPQYPRPQRRRERWRSLNGQWDIRTGASIGEAPPTAEAVDDCILVPFPVESALSGVGKRDELVWYRTTFDVPDTWAVGDDERLLVHFEAVDRTATVYINGTELGTHEGGYDHFAFDVTDHLVEGGPQELHVEVIDGTATNRPLGKQRTNPSGIYYTPVTGIWQSVWLEPVPESRVTDLDLRPDLESDALQVTAETANAEGHEVRATVTSGSSTVGTATGAPGDPLTVSIQSPDYWTPESPTLYDLTVELLDDAGGVVDRVESYAGMRSVSVERVDGTPRLMLNGERRFRMGTLDQGYWPDGIYTAPTEEALLFDIEAHLDLGFNTIRKHVKIEPRRWYYHTDRLGLLVWQDMPSMFHPIQDHHQAQFRRELRRMVEELHNHPSIEMWVPFNEGWGAFDVEGVAETVSEWDPERLVNRMSGYNVCECPGPGGDIRAVHNYTGPGPAPEPDERAVIVDEFGGVGLMIEDHLWNPAREYSYASATSTGDLTDAYVDLTDDLARLKEEGVSAGIWTQITDVEREVNGLYTYDRSVEKVDAERVRAANRRLRGVEES